MWDRLVSVQACSLACRWPGFLGRVAVSGSVLFGVPALLGGSHGMPSPSEQDQEFVEAEIRGLEDVPSGADRGPGDDEAPADPLPVGYVMVCPQGAWLQFRFSIRSLGGALIYFR